MTGRPAGRASLDETSAGWDIDPTAAVILVARVGDATGSKAAAAALACAGSEPDRAGLLIELSGGRSPRPALIATAAARKLEERLAVHLPHAGVASRGQICRLALPADASGVELVAAALPLVRGSVAAVHVPPCIFRDVLDEPRIRATGVLLRADLAADRALTALAARDLIEAGLRVAVLKRPLGWVAARRALLGALPERSGALPAQLAGRLLFVELPTEMSASAWYRRQHDAGKTTPKQEREDDARARRGQGFRRHRQRQADR